MDNSKTKVGNIEIILIIIGVKLGERLISLPGSAVTAVGYAAIISVFLGGLLAVFVAYFFARLSLNFPDKTIIEYSEDILGRVIGKIFILGLFIYFLIFCSIFIRRIGEFSKQEFLFNTPIEFIMLIFIFISSYCAIGGIPVIAKVSDFLIGMGGITTVVTIFIALPFINYQELLPAFQIENLKKVSILSPGVTSYVGIEFILFLIPFMKTPKDIKKNTLISMLALVAFLTVDIIIGMGVLSEEVLKYRIFPLFAVGKIIAFPTLFDIRFDIIYSSLWIFLIYIVMVIYEYLSSTTISGLFNLKSHSVFVFLLAPLFYVIGLLPQSLAQTFEVVNILDHIWLYGMVGAIFILYLIGVLRRMVKI